MKEGPTRNSPGPAAGRYPHPASHWKSEDAHKGIPCHVETLGPMEKNVVVILPSNSLDTRQVKLCFFSQYILKQDQTGHGGDS